MQDFLELNHWTLNVALQVDGTHLFSIHCYIPPPCSPLKGYNTTKFIWLPWCILHVNVLHVLANITIIFTINNIVKSILWHLIIEHLDSADIFLAWQWGLWEFPHSVSIYLKQIRFTRLCNCKSAKNLILYLIHYVQGTLVNGSLHALYHTGLFPHTIKYFLQYNSFQSLKLLL